MKKILLIQGMCFFYGVSFGQEIYKASVNNSETSKFLKSNTEILIPVSRQEITLNSAPTNDDVYIDFVGTGDIQKALNNGDNFNANTGLGVIFERYAGIRKVAQSFELEGTINIASTADTLGGKFSTLNKSRITNSRDFGTYILNPISSKQALYINSNLYFGYPHKDKSEEEEDDLEAVAKEKWTEKSHFSKFSTIVSGINVRVIASNSVWKYSADSIRNISALLFRAGVFHEFVPDNFRLTDEHRSKYSITVGCNYSLRRVLGDISAPSNDGIRNRILGTEQRAYQGIEANFGLRLYNLRAEFQMPVLTAKGSEVAGLTNTPFIFSVRFVGGFALKISKAK